MRLDNTDDEKAKLLTNLLGDRAIKKGWLKECILISKGIKRGGPKSSEISEVKYKARAFDLLVSHLERVNND